MNPRFAGSMARAGAEAKELCGYREEDGVPGDSQTETYAALRLFVDNWRWQDVPFYLRTGKRLARQASEVAIQFRAVPHQSFPAEATLDWQPSRIVMSIQPDEGIVLRFQAKLPGPKLLLRPVDMRFNYRESFKTPSPEAYETLLWDVMRNDATLFMRADQVEAAWRLLMPVLDVWKAIPPSDFPNYAERHMGTGRRSGPAGAPRAQVAVAGGTARRFGSSRRGHIVEQTIAFSRLSFLPRLIISAPGIERWARPRHPIRRPALRSAALRRSCGGFAHQWRNARPARRWSAW